MTTARPFLTAEWRYLAMLNYRVESELLRPFVPAGTTLDTWQGHAYVSVVGFLFRDTRLLGLPIPFHRTFEEVNLRCYVRRDVGGEVRRGVTFLRELVPRRAIAAVARLAYNEPYVALPMRHALSDVSAESAAPAAVEYAWRRGGAWSGLAVEPVGPARVLAAGSEEAFITEHYWGYTRQRDGATIEYQVAHLPWRLWTVRNARLAGDIGPLAGVERRGVAPVGLALAAALERDPDSAFLADGSPVSVSAPKRLPDTAPRARRHA